MLCFICSSPLVIILPAGSVLVTQWTTLPSRANWYRFQSAPCLILWPPLCTWPCSPFGFEQKIFHNNHKAQNPSPPILTGSPRCSKWDSYAKRAWWECGWLQGEAGAFRIIMNSNQGQEEAKYLYLAFNHRHGWHTTIGVCRRETAEGTLGQTSGDLGSSPLSPSHSGCLCIGPYSSYPCQWDQKCMLLFLEHPLPWHQI